ncbi:NLP/P60 protein [Xanthobacter versatilis]|uniref:NLP/P60 protein n=1 Tax=Xanthobacter autotrophicus (strain ATCC BAA-1158 / Py2) TaxID=78245 RepID=A7ILQ3_XANP2|nr:NLP/P60 protein [Xanthobacter autotrophicus Py2]
MHWSGGYLGLPFVALGRDRVGLDCYGLVRLVLAEERGVALPSLTEAYASMEERAEIAAALSGISAQSPWTPVARGSEQPFDIAMFSVFGRPLHLGIVVQPGLMLHVSDGHDSRIEDYRGAVWSRRLIAIYRHEALCPSS